MVRHVKVESQEIKLSAADFWALRWDVDCERYVCYCGGRALEVLSEAPEKDGSVKRNCRVAFLEDPVPGPLRRWVSIDDVVPLITSSFNPKRFDEDNAATIDVAVPGLGDRVSIRGTQWLVPGGESSCTLVSRVEVEVKMPFGVGGLVERAIEKEYDAAYRAMPNQIATFGRKRERSSSRVRSSAAEPAAAPTGGAPAPAAREHSRSHRASSTASAQSDASSAATFVTASEMNDEDDLSALPEGDDDDEWAELAQSPYGRVRGRSQGASAALLTAIVIRKTSESLSNTTSPGRYRASSLLSKDGASSPWPRCGACVTCRQQVKPARPISAISEIG